VPVSGNGFSGVVGPAPANFAGCRHAGLGPWALRTDRLGRHLLAGFTTTPDSITDDDLALFTRRLHAQGHPEAGSALYRNLILPEMGRFLASAAYRKRRLTVPTVSLMGGADAGVRPDMLGRFVTAGSVLGRVACSAQWHFPNGVLLMT
jgi:hypothetical protein